MARCLEGNQPGKKAAASGTAGSSRLQPILDVMRAAVAAAAARAVAASAAALSNDRTAVAAAAARAVAASAAEVGK